MLPQHLLVNEEKARHTGAARKVEFPSDVRRIATWILIGWSTWDDGDETHTFGKVAFKFRDAPDIGFLISTKRNIFLHQALDEIAVYGNIPIAMTEVDLHQLRLCAAYSTRSN
jgi:hypothetical protein